MLENETGTRRGAGITRIREIIENRLQFFVCRGERVWLRSKV